MRSDISKGVSAQAAGTKGKRFSMPNSRIMMHQPAGAHHLSFSMDDTGAELVQDVLELVRSWFTELLGDSALMSMPAPPNPGGAMGSADEVNIQASELNRSMKVRRIACGHQPCRRVTAGSATLPSCLLFVNPDSVPAAQQ